MEKETITIEELQERIDKLGNSSSLEQFFDKKIVLNPKLNNNINIKNLNILFLNCTFLVPPNKVLDFFNFNIDFEINESFLSFESDFSSIIFDNCEFNINATSISFNNFDYLTLKNSRNLHSITFVKNTNKCDINDCFFNNNSIFISNDIKKHNYNNQKLYSFENNHSVKKVTIAGIKHELLLKIKNENIPQFNIIECGNKDGVVIIDSQDSIINNTIIELSDIKAIYISDNFLKTSFLQISHSNIGSVHAKNVNFQKSLALKINESKSNNLEIDNLNVQLELTNSTINYSNITLSSIKAKAIKGTSYNNFNISNTCTIEVEDKNDIDTINTLREIFKNSNYHEYLQFHALSQNYLLKDKEGKLKCRDKILLWLNKNSNEFGTNWINGFLFTLAAGLFFYTATLISHPFVYCFLDKPLPNVNYEQVGRVGMGFIEYVTSTDLFFSNENSINSTLKQSNFFTLLFYTLGKIFVMYGIYQMIQAFRKYRN